MRFSLGLTLGVMLSSTAMAEPLPAPITDADFPTFETELTLLGRDLFFDPILSGNQNIACATCHHPSLGTSDAMSLSIGEGGQGLGTQRVVTVANKPHARIPRNAPALFNLGAQEFTVMFHDGRVQIDPDAMFGVRMPDGRTLERPLPSALAAQTILPILSPEEMVGQPGENPVADAVAAERIHGPNGAWNMLAKRVQAIPDYNARFETLGRKDVHITDIGAALAAYITEEFRATQSPFDMFLAGEIDLPRDAKAGMELFYGKARCGTCHAGAFQTDHQFYAIGLPQLGPGKNAHSPYADTGRGMITGQAADRYRFRTPTLRNVALTAPYGHNGAYASLEGIVRHHLDALTGLTSYDRSDAVLTKGLEVADFEALDDQDEMIRIAAAIEINDVSLTDREVAEIMAFLNTLTDVISPTQALGEPASLPSGLPLDPS